MKRTDIQKVLDSNPRTPFAVRVPRFRGGRGNGTETVKAVIEGFTPGRALLEAPRVDVGLSFVLAPWDAYKLDQDWSQAIQMDRRRDASLAYERERAERAAAIEALLPAFEGVMVPAESLSTANYDRPDVNLADALRETFAEGGAVSAMIGWEVFAAIAGRIQALSGWSGGAVDTGVPAITPLVPRTPLSEITGRLAKLEAAQAAARALPDDCPRCGVGAEGVCPDPECQA